MIAAACGSDDDDTTTTTAAPAEESSTTVAVEEPMDEPTKVGLVFDIFGRGDLSFNDSAGAGYDRANEDFNLDSQEVTPLSDGSNRESLLQLQADRGADIVIGVGFLFGDPIKKVAAANPDTNYAIIDSGITDATDNISMLLFDEHEGSYLMGVTAALKSEVGSIGFIGGVNVPLIHKFEAGYVAGARAIDPDIEINIQYLSEPPDFAGFNDPAGARVMGLSMYESGADIVYHAAGGSGNGLFVAAKEFSEGNDSKVWAIGVNSDQYLTADEEVKEYILTSMLKKVDVSVYETIKDVIEGNFMSGERFFGLRNNGIDYTTSGGFIDDIVDQLDDYKQQIIDGDIVVPDSV